MTEPECVCEERVDAPGEDFDGMILHTPYCSWLAWFWKGTDA